MEFPFFTIVIHEPDVMLTDLILCIETAIFAYVLLRGKSTHSIRISAGYLFVFLSMSSLFGALYHGLFPLKLATSAGWFMWICTMLSLGAAAIQAWLISAILVRPALRKIVQPALCILFACYFFYVTFFDERFLVSIVFSLPPLLVLLGVFVWKVSRGARVFLFGIPAILLMFIAALLQQLGTRIHPVYFNHNALYHLLQAVALALLFLAFRRKEPTSR